MAFHHRDASRRLTNPSDGQSTGRKRISLSKMPSSNATLAERLHYINH